MGMVCRYISPDDAEVGVLRLALSTKDTTEPALRQLRAALSGPNPNWAANLSTDTPLTAEKITSLVAALRRRANMLAAFGSAAPGPDTDTAVQRQNDAIEVLSRLHGSLTGTDLDDTGIHGVVEQLAGLDIDDGRP
jgi:hypothetical protein